MRAAVYFSKGDLEKGSLLMDKFIHSLSDEELLDPMMNFALQIYYKTRSVSVKPISLKNMAHLCKLEQPSGVKLKYWFGVGQIPYPEEIIFSLANTSASLYEFE